MKRIDLAHYVLFAICLIAWGPWMMLIYPAAMLASYALCGIAAGISDGISWQLEKRRNK
jgi:hypothetical protein